MAREALAVEIRPESSRDVAAIRDLHLHAFERRQEADLVDAVRRSLQAADPASA